MDRKSIMKDTIKRGPKETKKEAVNKPEPKVIYELNCKLTEMPSEAKDKDYNFTGNVKANGIDIDLLAIVLAKVIRSSVPNKFVGELLDTTAEKLGYNSEETEEEKEEKEETPGESIMDLIKKIEDLKRLRKELLGE